jgi:peptidoglycan/xylan/chitin deacetylase (PgdA/CDA1 family)
MKALRDNGISVISMQDLLAWRKGGKAIPSKSAVITIDDEWNSQYYIAWPILKEFGYPFTLFVYTQWVNTGGKAMTWDQLEEMRDAGVDIEAHSVSHHDLRHSPRGQDYTSWLHHEVYGCKETLENKLGVKIIAFAFPYGFHNEVVRKTAKEAGYELQFTVYGRHMDIDVPADQIGRYAIDSLKPDVFKAALDFGTTDSTQPGVETSQLASAAMLTEPLNDQHITEPKPTIKANLASIGNVDPKSVEMRISGFGLVPAVYDPKTKLVTYTFTQDLLPKMYTVILTARVNGKKVETRWEFTVDPARPRTMTPPRSRTRAKWQEMRPADSKAVCADSGTFLWLCSIVGPGMSHIMDRIPESLVIDKASIFSPRRSAEVKRWAFLRKSLSVSLTNAARISSKSRLEPSLLRCRNDRLDAN